MIETCTVNTIEEALEALGITKTTLSTEEKKHLDEKGYVIFYKLMEPAWLNEGPARRPSQSNHCNSAGRFGAGIQWPYLA